MYISERLLEHSPNQLPRLVACDKSIRPERPKCKRGQEALTLQPSMGRPQSFFIEAVRLTQKDSLTLDELDKRIFARALAKSDGPKRPAIVIRLTPIAIQAPRKHAQAGPTSRGPAASRTSCQSLCRKMLGLEDGNIFLWRLFHRLSERLIW
jgi:hypothetical protein